MARKTPKFIIDQRPLQQMEQYLSGVDAFLAQRNEIFRRVCQRLTPFAQKIMLDSLHKSGLHNRSGNLEKAVRNTICFPTRSGFRIGIARGLSAHEYAKDGALQYGSVHGASGLSARSKAKLKSALLASGGSGGGMKAHAPHPYYTLDAGQLQQIEAEFNRLLQEELDAFMAKYGQGRS
ncbi:MAG TPA: hypothetical protein VGP72_16515 [Planctomycetota bacterium]